MSERETTNHPIRILLQTTIPFEENGWNIGGFSMLKGHLDSLKDQSGQPLCEVTARDREADADGNDPVLSALDRSGFDELWLFAIDSGDGLSKNDCEGITRFRKRGGGILTTRDHQDLGSSLCTLGGIGAAHFFHTHHPDPDESRQRRDDAETKSISWPNYHSGSNGDYQLITTIKPVHELLLNPNSPSGVIETFPAHPHEGAVGVTEETNDARVIATGESKTTGRPFNLVVAFERSKDAEGNLLGRGIAESSFHHFVDYNWDPEMGGPDFIEEAPGDGFKREPHRLEDIKAYVSNLAAWLAPLNQG